MNSKDAYYEFRRDSLTSFLVRDRKTIKISKNYKIKR